MVVLLLVGFVVVLCVGMVIGGAVVYGVTQIGGILPDLGAGSRETRVDKVIEESRILEQDHGLLEPTQALGAYVVQVEPESPAEKAGLEQGDRILVVDGLEVGVDGDLAELIGDHEPGDQITLDVQRSGADSRELRVRLGENPDEPGSAWLGIRYSMVGPLGLRDAVPGRFGRFRFFDPDRLPDLFPGQGVIQGVVVTDVAEESPAADVGLESGDLILAIDDESVARPGELSEAIAAHQPGDRITLTIMGMAGGERREVEVRLAEHPDKPGTGYLGVFLGGGFRFERRRGPEGDDQSWDFQFDGTPFRFELPFDGEGGERWFQFHGPFGEGDEL
jgi:membrane-associated protease RseP (regulator of RpoE activity)